MTSTWFIAETNWNKHTILSNEKRSLEQSYDMNKALINNWNKIVHPHDIVYHLGNVFGNQYSYDIIKELNGNKILRTGSLDHHIIKSNWSLYFDEVYDDDILLEGQFCLSHKPLDEITSLKLVNNGFIIGNIFGQTIDNTMALDPLRYFSVSTKQIGLVPIHLNEIKKHFSIDESHTNFFNRFV